MGESVNDGGGLVFVLCCIVGYIVVGIFIELALARKGWVRDTFFGELVDDDIMFGMLFVMLSLFWPFLILVTLVGAIGKCARRHLESCDG